MSWLKIDDGFEDHAKVEPLSDGAHRLWMRAACWCKKPANEHTAGFVPRAMLRAISKNTLSQGKLEKLAQELVDATGGGIFEHGLWEPRDGGWLFHDWDQYQPKKEPLTPEERVEAARRAGRASAASRRAANGTAQPNKPRTPPNGTKAVRAPFGTSFDRTDPERPEPPDPDPDPDPRSKVQATTLDPPGRGAQPRLAVVVGLEIRCPGDLELEPEQRASLASGGVDSALIDEVTRWFRSKHAAGNDVRPVATWRSWLVTVISGRHTARRDRPPGAVEHELRKGQPCAPAPRYRDLKPENVAPMPLGETLAALELAQKAAGGAAE